MILPSHFLPSPRQEESHHLLPDDKKNEDPINCTHSSMNEAVPSWAKVRRSKAPVRCWSQFVTTVSFDGKMKLFFHSFLLSIILILLLLADGVNADVGLLSFWVPEHTLLPTLESESAMPRPPQPKCSKSVR